MVHLEWCEYTKAGSRVALSEQVRRLSTALHSCCYAKALLISKKKVHLKFQQSQDFIDSGFGTMV